MRFLILLLSALVLGSHIAAYAEGREDILIKNLLVIPPDLGPRGGPALGLDVQRAVWEEWQAAFRFEVTLPPDKAGLEPMTLKQARRLAKKTGSDTLVMSSLKPSGDQKSLTMTLINARSGSPIAIERVRIKSVGEIRAAVSKVVSALLGRIPYKAVVLSSQDNRVTINAGLIHGLVRGAPLTLFDVKAVQRHPFTQEVVGLEEERVAEATILSVDELRADAVIATLKGGRTVATGLFARFRPDLSVIKTMQERRKALLEQKLSERAKPEALRKEPMLEPPKEPPVSVAERPTFPKVLLGVSVGVATQAYEFRSPQFNIKRDTSSFPVAGVQAEYWFLRSFGLDVSYETGRIEFDSSSVSLPDVRSTPSWLNGRLNYRYITAAGGRTLTFLAGLGYGLYDFKSDKTDNTTFVDTRYDGLLIGVGTRVDWTPQLAGRISVEYQPSLSVEEEPSTSGTDATATAFGAGLDIGYRIAQSNRIVAQYQYRDYTAEFEGIGTRSSGVTAAETTDRLHSFYIGWKLYL